MADIPVVGADLVALDNVEWAAAGVESAIQTVSQLVTEACLLFGAGHRVGAVQANYTAPADGQSNAANFWQRHMHDRNTGRFGHLVKISRPWDRYCVRRYTWQIASLPRTGRQ